MLVVDKPAGRRRSIPGAGTTPGRSPPGCSRSDAAGGDDPERPGIVHRLDRDTSGLLVVARSERAFAALQAAIREHEVERRYLALVRGTPQSRTGPDRRPDRPRPPRSARGARSTRRAAGGRDLVRGRGAARPSARCSTCGSRPGGRTRSASTSRRSSFPSSGDPDLRREAATSGSSASSCTRTGCAFDHPVAGEQLDLESPLPDDLARARSPLARADGGS